MLYLNTPLEIVIDYGSQFLNQLLTVLMEETQCHQNITWHTIQYSEIKNDIVKCANKDVNRHIRNILLDKEEFKNWTKMLCMTDKLLNSPITQPLGIQAPYSSSALQIDTSLLGIIDQDIFDDTTIRQRLHWHTYRSSALPNRCSYLISKWNLRRQYSHYSRCPNLRQHFLSGDDDPVIDWSHYWPYFNKLCSSSGSNYLRG